MAGALGITLDSDPDALVDHAQRWPTCKASMLQDILDRQRTEVAALGNGIVGSGARPSTPLNKAIWALIDGLEHSWTLAK